MITNTPILNTIDKKKGWFSTTLLFTWVGNQTQFGQLIGGSGGYLDEYAQDEFDMQSIFRSIGDVPTIKSIVGTVRFDTFNTGTTQVIGFGPMVLTAPDTGIAIAVGPSGNVVQDLLVPSVDVSGNVLTYSSFSVPFITLGTRIVVSKICDMYGTPAPLTFGVAGAATITLCTFDVAPFFK